MPGGEAQIREYFLPSFAMIESIADREPRGEVAELPGHGGAVLTLKRCQEPVDGLRHLGEQPAACGPGGRSGQLVHVQAVDWARQLRRLSTSKPEGGGIGPRRRSVPARGVEILRSPCPVVDLQLVSPQVATRTHEVNRQLDGPQRSRGVPVLGYDDLRCGGEGTYQIVGPLLAGGRLSVPLGLVGGIAVPRGLGQRQGTATQPVR